MTSQTLDAVLYKKQALPEKNRFPAVIDVAWRECPDCDDFFCNIHGVHAYDCACPVIDEWAEADLYPYGPSALRYITPVEAERLQGFPDGWTEYGGPELAGWTEPSPTMRQSDSIRYHQLGNAVAVPVVEWLGRRIVEAEQKP